MIIYYLDNFYEYYYDSETNIWRNYFDIQVKPISKSISLVGFHCSKICVVGPPPNSGRQDLKKNVSMERDP